MPHMHCKIMANAIICIFQQKSLTRMRSVDENLQSLHGRKVHLSYGIEFLPIV